MKLKMIACSALAAALLTGCININTRGEGHGRKCEMGGHQCRQCEKGGRCQAKNKEACQAKLMAQAKISKQTAEQIALAKVHGGAIKDGELEMENGKLQWSFDMATPDSKDITEVNVDAINGQVISAAQEAPETNNDGDKD